MRNKVHKFCGILILALVPGAAGCTAVRVGYGQGAGNPPFETGDYSYVEDGVQSGDTFRICFDGRGALYPDPQDPSSNAWERIPDRISRHCRGGRPLLVLIHGCNNTYPEARRSYDLVRLVVQDRMSTLKPVFLEVYWDALSGNAFALWEPARENSKWVGLGLRRIFSRLDPAVPVRVITHSRGAAVICSALWNVPLDEGARRDLPYAAEAGKTPLLLPDDVRIALLAPAIGPSDLALGATESRVRRVLVGINEDDPVLGKGPLPPTWFGDTSLGCSKQTFQESVEPAFEGRARAVDLSASLVHDFKDYLLRRAFLEKMLPDLVRTYERAPGVTAGTR